MTGKVQKIRNEVERVRNLHQMKYQQLETDNKMCLVECGKRNLCNDLLYFIDSLQEEPVSEDLEKAGKEWLAPQLDNSYADYGEGKMMELTHFDGYAMLDAIDFGAKWQEAKDQSTIELAEEHAMLAGMNKMEQQMMANAIEAVVSQVPCSNEIILYNPSSVAWYYLPQEMNKLGLNKGDKVKVIIIKKD